MFDFSSAKEAALRALTSSGCSETITVASSSDVAVPPVNLKIDSESVVVSLAFNVISSRSNESISIGSLKVKISSEVFKFNEKSDNSGLVSSSTNSCTIFPGASSGTGDRVFPDMSSTRLDVAIT